MRDARAEARANGREIGVFTIAVIVCRPTRRQAEDDFHSITEEQADWSAVDSILAMRGLSQRPPEDVERFRREYVVGNGGQPFVGDADDVAAYLAQLSEAGLTGAGLSLVNYADELPFFRQEVLPRLETMDLRVPPSSQTA